MRWLRDRDNVVLLALLLLGLTAYFTVKNYNNHVGGVAELDGYYYYVYLRSLQMDGDIDFTNEYKEWGNPFDLGEAKKTGLARNIFGVGPAILWAPFFLITHLLCLLGIKLGYPLSVDGLSRFHVVGTLVGSLIYGWIAVVLVHRLARDMVGKKHALWATLGAVLAGPLPFYCLALASYSHAPAAMANSLLCLLWFRWRGQWTLRRWALFGASAGLVMLVRPACMPFMILPLVEGVVTLWRPVRARAAAPELLRAAAGPALGALAAVLVFSPQLVVWKIIFGEFLTVPQGEGFMRWSESSWASTLFSPRNGVFTMAPLLGLGLVGLVLGARRRPGVALPLTLVIVGMALINGAAYDWWGWGFSARRFTSALPVFAVGLALLLAAIRDALARRPERTVAWVTASAVALFILFNVQWMLAYSQRAMTWYNLRNTQAIYMTITHGVVDRVYRAVGNPLSLPASLAFKLRRGGSLRTYDRLDGHFMLGENHPLANPAADQMDRAGLDLADPRAHFNLSENFGYPITGKDKVRYVPLREVAGHIFLPINRPGAMELRIGCRAVHPGTHVELRMNGRKVGAQTLPGTAWSMITARVEDGWLERGINRLDLIHTPPEGWDRPGPRAVGRTGRTSPVDIAAVSGGGRAGNFAELWVSGRKVSDNSRGVNIAAIHPTTGEVLGVKDVDVVLRPFGWRHVGRFLDRFPKGTLIVLAERDHSARHFDEAARAVLARFGAATDLEGEGNMGYVALGVLGAPKHSAMESVSPHGHARVHVGRKPPPWREVMRYRFLQVR